MVGLRLLFARCDYVHSSGVQCQHRGLLGLYLLEHLVKAFFSQGEEVDCVAAVVQVEERLQFQGIPFAVVEESGYGVVQGLSRDGLHVEDLLLYLLACTHHDRGFCYRHKWSRRNVGPAAVIRHKAVQILRACPCGQHYGAFLHGQVLRNVLQFFNDCLHRKTNLNHVAVFPFAVNFYVGLRLRSSGE